MALELPIYVYGNGDLYRELFNAIAASLNDKGYSYLIKLAILMTGTWAIFRYSLDRNIMGLVRWLMTYYVAFYIIFIPKATVEIIDLVNADTGYAVDNIPLGLAVIASYTSRMGAGMTELMEQNFSLPDDLNYGKTGMVMASRLVLDSTQFQVTDPNFTQSLQSFVHQCVFYDLLLNKYSWNDLLTTQHIWPFVESYASPARAFLYYQPGGGSQIITCQNGAKLLDKDWKTAISQAASQYGARLFPDAKQANNQLLTYLPTAYQFLTNISDDASSIMQQNMMANALQNGILRMGSTTNAPAALEAYAFTKAQQQKRLTNQTVGDMAAYWLPIMKNVLEALLYGAFIFVFLLILFPFGQSVFNYYLASLLWIQMWAPLYAILNLFMNFYAQKHSLGALNLGNNATGLTLTTQGGFAQVNADVASLAGYLSLSVPLLATGIVKGMMGVFSMAAQYMAGVTQGAATSAAGEAVSGNLSLGNTNFNNHSAYNTSANHFDTNARVSSGMFTEQLAGGSTLSMTSGGAVVMNNQGAISSLGTSINLANTVRNMASQQADTAYSAALNSANAYVDSVSTGLRTMNELGDHMSRSHMSGSGSSVSISGGTSDALNNVHQLTEKFAHDHNISTAEATRYLGAAYASASAGGSLSELISGKEGTGIGGLLSAHIGGKIEGDKSHSHESKDLYSAAQDFVHNTNYSQNVDTAIRGIQEHSYRASDEAGQRLIDNMGSSFDQADSARTELSSSFQQSQSYREIASYAEENATAINSNASQAFMNSLEQQGYSASQIENMMVNNPQISQAVAEQFTQSQAQQYLQNFQASGSSSAQSVLSHYDHNSQAIPGNAQIADMNDQNYQLVANKASSQDLNQGSTVDRQAEQDAQKIIKDATSKTQAGGDSVNQKGAIIQSEIKKKN